MSLVAVPSVVAPSLYDVITSAAFTSQTSLPFTWTAGAYRRLVVHLHVTTSGGGNVGLTLAGLGGTYSSWSTYNQSGASIWGAGALPAAWAFGNGAYVGQTDANIQVAAGGLRTFQADMLDATNGYLLLSRGSNTDTTSLVSGITFAFPSAASGWLELLGFT